MAKKKETEPLKSEKLDYKDSSLHHDLTEIKVLLGCMMKDIETLNDNIKVITDIEKMRAGM